MNKMRLPSETYASSISLVTSRSLASTLPASAGEKSSPLDAHILVARDLGERADVGLRGHLRALELGAYQRGAVHGVLLLDAITSASSLMPRS